MANAIEQALLLPIDMANLGGMRSHEVFLSLKRDFALVSLLTNLFLLCFALYIYIYICTQGYTNVLTFLLLYIISLPLASHPIRAQGRRDS